MSDPQPAAFPRPTSFDWRRATHGADGEPARSSRWDGGIALPAVVPWALAPPAATHAAASWPRGGWSIAAELPFSCPTAWNTAACADLALGLDHPLAVIECAPGDGGLAIDCVEALERAYAGIDLARVPFGLDAGECAARTLGLVLALAERRGVPAEALTGFVAGDPLAALARTPNARPRAPGASAVALDSHRVGGLSTLLADGTVYREAGATAVDELAFALASLAEQLRGAAQRDAHGPVFANAPIMRLSAGMEVVMEMSRMRAAREAAAQLLVAFGVPSARARVKLLLVPSRRAASPLDAGNHLVRSTLVALAGACGGADMIALDAHPVPTPAPDPAARRAARMAQLVLRVECGLDRVVDPAGGAPAIELMTRRLGEAAWRRFQEVEAQGGLARALAAGWVQAEVLREAQQARERVTARTRPIIGVSTSPDPRERATLSVAPVGAFAPVRDGEPFERLRRAAASYAARIGTPPRVLVALLGPSRDYRARADWVAELFASGGFEPAVDREFASAEAAADAARAFPVAVATGLDARYAVDVPALARALVNHAAATRLYVAGRPPDEATERVWRGAGVAGFAHARANPHAFLAGVLRELGEVVDE